MANRGNTKAQVQAYIQDLIDARCPGKIGSAEDLAEAVMSTIDNAIG